jgi:hypothetical protein
MGKGWRRRAGLASRQTERAVGRRCPTITT